MTKVIKIFSDGDEYELEKEINHFLQESKAEIIDFKFDVSKPEDGEKIITVVMSVNLP
jgi:hypothetical protein